MKSLVIAFIIAVAAGSPVQRVVAPGLVGPTPVVDYEPIAVGPAIVDSFEPISVGPAIVDSFEPISVGPAIVDSFEPISVGPAIVDSYEPITVGPALVDAVEPAEAAPAVPDSASNNSPTVSIVVNINIDGADSNVVSVESMPAVISPATPIDATPETISVVESAPETVTVIDGMPDSITVVDSVQNPIVSVDMSLIQEIIAAIQSPNTHPSTAAVLEAQLQEILGLHPVAVGPAVVESKPEEPVVGPAIVDVFEPIAIGPAMVDNQEPIHVGPAIVDNYEAISVGPAIVDNVEPISVGPAIVGPIEETAVESPDSAAATESSTSPVVQIVLNIVQDQMSNIEIPEIVHDAVSIVEATA